MCDYQIKYGAQSHLISYHGISMSAILHGVLRARARVMCIAPCASRQFDLLKIC
jgi:hypothetical protein